MADILYPVGSLSSNNQNRNDNYTSKAISILHPFSNHNSKPKPNASQNQEQSSTDSIGYKWSNNTKTKSKILIKQLILNELNSVDIEKDGFKRNEWYIYIDIDNNNIDKIWITQAHYDYETKVYRKLFT